MYWFPPRSFLLLTVATAKGRVAIKHLAWGHCLPACLPTCLLLFFVVVSCVCLQEQQPGSSATASAALQQQLQQQSSICGQQQPWSKEQLASHVQRHAVSINQHPDIKAMTADCSQERVVQHVLHFFSLHGNVAHGRQHSIEGTDWFFKVEAETVQAAVWAGMQPDAPCGLRIYAMTLLQRAFATEHMSNRLQATYTWRWDTIWGNVGLESGHVTQLHGSGSLRSVMCA